MVIDLELTLNRFGFRRIQKNKLQIAFFRIAWWNIQNKYAVSFEINWHINKTVPFLVPQDMSLTAGIDEKDRRNV